MYWTSVSGSGRRQTRQVSRRAVRRAPPPSYRVPATPEQNRLAAYGCLAAIGIAITIGLAIASSGIALIPIGLGIGLFVYLGRRRRNHKPGYIAQQLIKQALVAPNPIDAVGLLHEAIDTDPGGKDTLLACADWFHGRQCWADAADAYAGYLHIESTSYYEIRHAQCLVMAGHLDEAVVELGHLRSEGPDESDRALVLSLLAWTFALKGDPSQGLAFANEAGLQKHNLTSGAQRCLMMRGTCRYLTGQKSKAIEDIERLYAINPSPEVLDLKTRMQSGTFHLDVPKPYPDWYPAKVELREGPIVEQIQDGHADELVAGSISPDRRWRWSGSQWEPMPESEAASQSVPPSAPIQPGAAEASPVVTPVDPRQPLPPQPPTP